MTRSDPALSRAVTYLATGTVRKGMIIRCWPGACPGSSFVTVALSDPFMLSGHTEVVRE